jgi:glycosyltransferase involved in cell wall biosynthesis
MAEPEISLVVPLHNEEGNLPVLYEEIKAVLEGLGRPYEIVFVNDASTDGTQRVLEAIKEKDPTVRVIVHEENYGEAQSLSSGFCLCRGRVVVTMDGDGQNDPRDIPSLLDKLRDGYKAVSGWRVKRKESFLSKVLPSFVANRLIALVTGVKVHDTGCGLKAYRGELVRGVVVPHGFHRFLPAYFGVEGREVAEVKVKDRQRLYGTSHYGLSRTKEVLRDLLTFPFVSNYRKWLPVMASLLLGCLFLCLVSFLLFVFGGGPLYLKGLIVFAFLCFALATMYRNLRRVAFIKEKRIVKRREL